MISLLSVERFLGISNFINTPNKPPSKSTKRLNIIGLITLERLKLPEFADIAADIAIL